MEGFYPCGVGFFPRLFFGGTVVCDSLMYEFTIVVILSVHV